MFNIHSHTNSDSCTLTYRAKLKLMLN